jgi:acid phosphatase
MQFRFRPARPGLIAFAVSFAGAALPKPDHVVIAIYENHGDSSVVGSPKAPYINSLAADPHAARFTQSYALTHPSQPNYLMLFSGANQGVTNDNVPANLPFKTSNLGAALLAKGVSFHAYSEDLPSAGFTGASNKGYARKHAPWVNWQGAPANAIPASAHDPMTAFPTDYSKLATVTFVVPNLQNDMHDGTVQQGDAWLKANLDGYVQWAKTHNSLFILTFDEDEGVNGGATANRIPTLFVGQMIKPGSYSARITHYDVLRTLEDMYGTAHSGAAADAKAIADAWLPATGLAPRRTVTYLLRGDGREKASRRADGRAAGRFPAAGFVTSAF